MKRSRKAVCRTNKKLALLSTQYDNQNIQLEAAGSIQMFHYSGKIFLNRDFLFNLRLTNNKSVKKT